jgi:hypothetical protein
MKASLILCLAFAALAVAIPATAATPTFTGTVGPGFTISMKTKPTKAGKTTLVLVDKASNHNFHLRDSKGKNVAGVDAKTKKAVTSIETSVGATGTRTFTLTLKKGTYTFVCDPHSSFMKGSFTVK